MQNGDKTPTISASDFDTTEIEKAFNDIMASKKAGDDEGLKTALADLEKLVSDALGKSDDGKKDEGEQPDPFQAVQDKYTKKGA